MKIGVRVLPRPEVLDTQGRAVEQTLKDHGFKVNQCHIGKYIELDVDAENESQALAKAEKLAEFVLYNPLIESFEMEVVKE